MYSKYLSFFCVLYCIQCSFSKIASLDIKPNNLLKMQKGLGRPHSLEVAEGHEALMSLSRSLDNQQSCTVTSPTGLKFEVSSPPSNRFVKWGDGCGVRVKNVAKVDEGRWRLSAASADHSVMGWIEVFVQNVTSQYIAPEIQLQDGQTDTSVVLTTLENSYCLVAQPYSESSLVPGHCQVTLSKATRAVQGDWSVLLGLPGRVQELMVHRKVSVEAERLDVGYVHDTNANKLHLYCNILYTEKNITFCRFQKTTSPSGYNIMDGLSDGTHSYYGNGFLQRQCGMTIETPKPDDYSTWRCSVGVQQWNGTKIEPQTPLQALISVAFEPGRSITRDLSEQELHTVFVQEDKSFTIMCRASVSLSYCWFQHPNRTQYTPRPLTDENQEYWYSGQSLNTGECGITFAHAKPEDEGEWTCHMGPKDTLGVETIDRFQVRVTGSLAANRKEIAASIGDTVTLYCHSSNGNRPLEYCRFLTPSLIGLSVDSSVTEENAILGRYYFTPGRNLDYGDCSLTINSLTEEDIGEWTCASLIDEDIEESRDTITLIETVAPRSRAGIVGMAVGSSVLVVILAGYVAYKKVDWSTITFRRHTPTESEAGVVVSFDISSLDGRTSLNSNDSFNSSSNSEIVIHEASRRGELGR